MPPATFIPLKMHVHCIHKCAWDEGGGEEFCMNYFKSVFNETMRWLKIWSLLTVIFLKNQFHLSSNIKKTPNHWPNKPKNPAPYEQNLAHFSMFLPQAVSNNSWMAQCLLTWILIHKDQVEYSWVCTCHYLCNTVAIAPFCFGNYFSPFLDIQNQFLQQFWIKNCRTQISC